MSNGFIIVEYYLAISGRSLHAQEIQFNDIRTTLQALYALFDNCNSLHTNAYDEAITTPTPESMRRAVAIPVSVIVGSLTRNLGSTSARTPGRAVSSSMNSPTSWKKSCTRSSNASPSAAACWAPWTPHEAVWPARQDPGRVHVLRAQKARR